MTQEKHLTTDTDLGTPTQENLDLAASQLTEDPSPVFSSDQSQLDEGLAETKNDQVIGESLADASTEAVDSLEDLEEVEVEIHSVPDYQAGPSLVAVLDQGTFNRLTKKNQQYLIAVDKLLSGQPLVESTYKAVMGELTETLIQGQKSGQTARHLYGTPTECAQTIREQHFPTKAMQEPTTPSEAWQLGLDGSLLLGSIYTLMTGISLLNNSTIAPGLGLLTVIVNYIVAGFAMLLIARNLPHPDAPKGEKGYLKYFAMSTLAMVSWVGAVSLATAILPPVLNPILPPIALITIGAVTLAARFYVKKRLNIRGGIF